MPVVGRCERMLGKVKSTKARIASGMRSGAVKSVHGGMHRRCSAQYKRCAGGNMSRADINTEQVFLTLVNNYVVEVRMAMNFSPRTQALTKGSSK